jgi:hypothetical protein
MGPIGNYTRACWNSSISDESLESLSLDRSISKEVSRDLSQLQRTWFAIYSDLYILGCDKVTILHTRECLESVYLNRGVAGFATTIKLWNRCTRELLENSPRTLRTVRSDVPFSRTFTNLAETFRSQSPCFSQERYKEVLATHGDRPVPPYLTDLIFLEAFMANPSYKDFAILGSVSSLGRVVMPPSGEQPIVDTMKVFTLNVEREQRQFDFTKVAKRFTLKFQERRPLTTSAWKAKTTSSREFSLADDGKVGELRERLIHGFMELSCLEFFLEEPTDDLYDITGNLAYRAGHIPWDPLRPIAWVLYVDLLIEPVWIDERLGQIGLLWALNYLRESEEATYIFGEDSPEFNSTCLSTAEEVDIRLGPDSSIMARVVPLPEEGWKVRVITITGMAIAMIGQLARSMVDPIMWSDQLIKIGLLEPSKLWKFLEVSGGRGSALPGRINPLPRIADSVDLSTATDTAHLLGISTTLVGFLEGMIKCQSSRFLRLAFDVASSARTFSISPEVKMKVDLPKVHRNGIMMGEGLSGIFLNLMSGIVRGSVGLVFEAFPELRHFEGGNDEMDLFIEDNHVRIQSWVDSLPGSHDTESTQSGDDVVKFSVTGNLTQFIFMYRLFGMQPSETTWYVSDRYALFTEEVAIRTHDSNGWSIIDAIKPRIFQSGVSDEYGETLVSKLALLTSNLRYEDKTSGKFLRAQKIAVKLLLNEPEWFKQLDRFGTPIGLPKFLGGIGHPAGLCLGYVESLDEADARVIAGMRSLDSKESLEMLASIMTDDIENATECDDTRLITEIILAHMSASPPLDVTHHVANDPKVPWWKTRDARKAFAKANELVSIYDVFLAIVGKIQLGYSIKSNEPIVRVRASKACRSRSSKLRTKFGKVALDPYDMPSGNDIWKIRERIVLNAQNLLVPKSCQINWESNLVLASLTVRFK